MTEPNSHKKEKLAVACRRHHTADIAVIRHRHHFAEGKMTHDKIKYL
jgi:hypothetical protein